MTLSLSRLRQYIPKLIQLKQIGRVLDSRERWIVRIALAVFLLVLAIVCTSFIKNHVASMPLKGGTYREAVVGTPRFINPILASSDVDKDLVRLMYASLLRYNDQGELVGDLAKDFSIEQGGTLVSFTLNDNIFWHDGERINTDDVVFTLESIKNQAWRSPLWRSFQNVTVEALDEKTVSVKSSAFIASFPHLFTAGILPKHVWENVDLNTARLAVWNIKPVGSGPFQFKSLGKSSDGTLNFYHLSRFSQYHKGEPFIKEIVIEFFPDFESAVAALREHTVDGVSFVPARLYEKIPSASTASFKFDFPHFTGIFFQDRKLNLLRDKAVRRALAAAVDREKITDLVPNAVPAAASFLKGQVGHARTIRVPNQDLNLAAEILTEGGWKKDNKGWHKGEVQLEVTLTSLDEPMSLIVSDAIRKSWEELGVKVTLEAASRLAFERDVLRSRDYEILVFSLLAGADPDPYPFWHSSQIDVPGLNLSSVRSRSIDVALERGRSIADPASRLNYYLELQKLLHEEVPGIVLYSSPYVYAVSKRVQGISRTIVSAPADRWNGVEQWFVRSRPGWQ